MNLKFLIAFGMLTASSTNAPSNASVTEFTNKSAWQSVAGPHTTIGFTDYPHGTLVTNQYAPLGALFTDGLDFVLELSSFPNDGHGLYGAIDSITVEFLQPQYSIAVHHPGLMQFDLYWEGTLTYTSSLFTLGTDFSGLISPIPFDKARIFDPTGGVYIDDLHFGPPIPAPGALGLMLGAAAAMTRTRRRNG